MATPIIGSRAAARATKIVIWQKKSPAGFWQRHCPWHRFGWAKREVGESAKSTRALTEQIHGLAKTFLTTDDEAKEKSALADARAIPSVAKVVDAAAYAFVMVNMLGQSPEFTTWTRVKAMPAPT